MKVVFLHGIHGATPRKAWLEPLNRQLSSQWAHRIDEMDIIEFDYSAILSGSAQIKSDPPRPGTTTDQEADASLSVRSEFLRNQQLLHEILKPRDRASSWLTAVPPRLANKAAHRDPEVENYISRRNIRSIIWSQVIERIPEGEPIVLIGHSLGSVIAVDVVSRLAPGTEVALLLTVASPLGRIKDLRRHSHALMSESDFPYARVSSWVNIYDPGDVVTVSKGIAQQYPLALDVPVEIGRKSIPVISRHEAELYMSHPALATAVGCALSRIAPAAPPPNLPARTVDPMWHILIAKFAYAQALHDVIPPKQSVRRRHLRLAREELAREAVIRAEMSASDMADMNSEGGHAESDLISSLQNSTESHPSAADLIDSPAQLIEGKYEDKDLAPVLVALASGLPVPPFEIESRTSADRRQQALAKLLSSIRTEATATTRVPSGDLAQIVTESIHQGRKIMNVADKAPWLKWVALGAAGVGVIAATILTAGLAAPAGLAGGAAIVAALAAFGPGGMVGGVALIAALTGSGMALVSIGTIGGIEGKEAEDKRRQSQRRAQVQAALIEQAERNTPDQLRIGLSTLLAVVVLQEHEKLNLPSSRPELLAAVTESLSSITHSIATARLIDPDSDRTSALKEKSPILERARKWLAQEED